MTLCCNNSEKSIIIENIVRNVYFILLFFLVITATSPAGAGDYLYRIDSTVLGSVKHYNIVGNESLIELARKFDLGYNEIVDANPDIDPFVPGDGSSVLVPTSWILPDIKEARGIVINLSELRLYFFFANNGQTYVRTYPIGIGSQGAETPVGSFSVIEKIVGPAWHVPASIRKENPDLPLVVPPGPENPMGSHALRLSLGTVLIHGTDRPYAVGRKASHGCLRLYPEDIPKLFRMVRVGTKVTIVRQPVKAGVRQGKVYIEVHKDETREPESYYKTAVDVLLKKQLLGRVSAVKFLSALRYKRGFPVDISPGGLEDSPPAEFAVGENHLREELR